jgi:transcriptional regulator with GAF, ATPase, and Fis domain
MKKSDRKNYFWDSLGAAARLGLQRTTLIAKMQKLGITRAQA